MDMNLLGYTIKLDSSRIPIVTKDIAGQSEENVLLDSECFSDNPDRTEDGLKLEIAYRILEDYKGIETSEEYLEDFADHFLSDLFSTTKTEVAPATIEEWLDKRLDAPEEHITGQKNDLK